MEADMSDDGDTRSEIERLNQEESQKQMMAHLPTNEQLRAEIHAHIRYSDGPLDCRGRLEVVDCFGTATEDANGNKPTEAGFNKTTAETFDYAFATVRCQEPDCKYPLFVMANPRRQVRVRQKPQGGWYDRKKLAAGDKS